MYIYLFSLVFFASIVGFIMMWRDKRKAERHQWRISEGTLWAVAISGGAPGMWLGMMVFRHKTKHIQFKYGLPILTIIWMIFLL
ncbi:DUF1294 domain-containing protein [Halalkalibacillus sediminis]|uniref:DUF1294 domain-containing protein n=1 Tax=Halalkalibacillus sediminis TaxID=2018042 RepID=A0A2I0QY38_9BACI|nr:DUF1294 domain-containing protein [Halalkalibacillus sediminis]PKR79245.1 DUF1294 domain-containing protein [Halalkalibacillus sediminis]